MEICQGLAFIAHFDYLTVTLAHVSQLCLANYALFFSWLETHVRKIYTLSAMHVQYIFTLWAYLTWRHDIKQQLTERDVFSPNETEKKMRHTLA